jgi:beta-glucuronidase
MSKKRQPRTAAKISKFKPGEKDRPKAVPASAMPIFAEGRERVSLDGVWRVQVDPMRTGWQRKYWVEREEVFGGRHVEFAYDAWTKIRVPCDWNTRIPEMAHYEGPAWYARRFDFAPRRNERLFLRFGAANYIAQVFLNGEMLGEHEGGFTPFEFEVTGKVGRHNTLVVMVDNTMRPEGAPTDNYDWFNYGGLTRSVEIIRAPKCFVREFRVALVEKRGKSFVRAEVTVDGPGAPPYAEFAVSALGIGEHVRLKGGRGAVEVPADPERWSPENPKLYPVRLSAGEDHLVDHVGFRTVERRGRQILLNGEPVYLCGISYHEERPSPGGGRALRPKDIGEVFRQVKALGCNFVRLAHYPHTEEMARTADRLGVMLWEEIPVYWRVHFGDRTTLANCRQQMEELVRRDRNRASVIIWSVGNETPNIRARDRFFEELVGVCRRLDKTRLVGAAFFVEHGPGNVGNTDRRGIYAPIARKLDVVGINEYFGWYSTRKASEWKTMKWEVDSFECPVVFSELGGGALAGLHGRPGELWTEEHQAEIYRRQVRMIGKLEWCAGLSPWILFDFRSLLRTNTRQRGYNRKGLVAPGGKRKLAFKVLRDYYRSKPGGGG